MKKILAVMMALAMVLCLAVSVSAEDPVIKEGDVTYTVETEWWEMHSMEGVVYDSPEDLANISKIVFTISPSAFVCYSSKEIVDASKNGHWQQTAEVVSEFTINVSDMLLEETTDTDGNVSPYIYICPSTTAGTEIKVHYVVYGKEAADAPAAEDTSSDEAAEAPADDTAAADQGTAEDGTAADNNTVAPEDTSSAEAPSTGLALAVLPAVVAMAAAVVAKKH